DLAQLDAAAVERVREEAAPAPRDPEELHDALLSLVVLRPEARWREWFGALVAQRRAFEIAAADGSFWVAAERRDTAFRATLRDEDDAIAEMLRGHLSAIGPATSAALVQRTGLSPAQVERGAAALEAGGFALRGHFDPAASEPEWCARHLLAR